MVRHREVGAAPPQVPVGKGEPLKGLGRCHLVKQVTIYINERRTVFALLHEVRVPKFVV